MKTIHQRLKLLKEGKLKYRPEINEEIILRKIMHIMCSTYGWDYYTLMKQPPFFIFMKRFSKTTLAF